MLSNVEWDERVVIHAELRGNAQDAITVYFYFIRLEWMSKARKYMYVRI
jgi:hypothetical protein